jgi:hypothetical protein
MRLYNDKVIFFYHFSSNKLFTKQKVVYYI